MKREPAFTAEDGRNTPAARDPGADRWQVLAEVAARVLAEILAKRAPR